MTFTLTAILNLKQREMTMKNPGDVVYIKCTIEEARIGREHTTYLIKPFTNEIYYQTMNIVEGDILDETK